ncbi:MAG TPA: choice-of-anchor Q domain-containing protein [Gammaproteobacteria bacterium]|nr:hypothetical protein [Xanthomonadales bacterium]HPI96232.1 choice-of-anchor Q domain-containing protein [Gammaproteobacteria bacterium]HPQ88326.1 choice-of-anchor Q domain-containing protein [Gammaproteobacteria bacterium]
MKKLLVFFLLFANPVYSAVINIGPNGCTLQDAIRSANNDSSVGNCSAGSGTDTIIAPDGWSISLSSTLPTLTSNMTIRTETTGGYLTITGNNNRIMKVTGASTVVNLTRLVFREAAPLNTTTGGSGLKIDDATVNIYDSFFILNRDYNGKGGAIYIDSGVLNLNRTTLEYNLATIIGESPIPLGGGIYAKNSEVNISESTFFHNRTELERNVNGTSITEYKKGSSIYMEGGVLNFESSLINEEYSGLAADDAVVNFINSTIAKSLISQFSEMLEVDGATSLTFNHATISAPINIYGTTLLIATNSIFAHYCDLGNNVNVVINSQNKTTGQWPCTDIPLNSIDAELLTLADNGGATRTQALHHTSEAIDIGDATYCLATDQRGETRGPECDIGAYEVTDYADVRVELDIIQSPPYVSGQEVNANISVTNQGPGVANAIQVDYTANRFFIQSVNSGLCSQLPCTLNQISSGQQIDIPIVATLGNYTQNTFDVTVEAHSTAASNHDDPDEYQTGENNEFTTSGNINRGADMGIEMNLLTSPPYFINQTLNYQAIITNHGQDSATNIDFDLALDGQSLVQFSGCSSTNQNHCFLNQLLNQQDVVIDIATKVTDPLFNAEAGVSSNQIDVDLSNNTDDQGNQGAVEETDVSISIIANQSAPYYSYDYVTFDVTVKTDDKPASNVKIWVDVPGADWIGMSGCGSIPCEIATMTAFDSITMTAEMFLPIHPDNGQLFNWQVEVYAEPGQTDSDLSNNQSAKVIQIMPVADMFVSVDLITDPPYYIGQEVSYEVTAINGGLNRATQVDFTPNMTNLTLLWVAGDQCSDINCQLSQMDFAQREEMVLQFVINNSGGFNFGYSVQANEHDSNTSNNNDLTNGGNASLPPNDLIFENGFE